MAFVIVCLLTLFWTTYTLADDQLPQVTFNTTHPFHYMYNHVCQELEHSLRYAHGCYGTVADCTEFKCTDNILGNKELTLTIKINKCDDPLTIDVKVQSTGFLWEHKFLGSDDRIAIPGLSFTPVGKLQPYDVYIKIFFGFYAKEKLRLKIVISTNYKNQQGDFVKFNSSTVADIWLPLTQDKCPVRLSILGVICVVAALVVFFIVSFWCACCNKCRTTKWSPGAVMSTTTTVPMEPLVNVEEASIEGIVNNV